MNKLDAYEEFAFSYFLSAYPAGAGRQAIFDMMMDYSDEIEYLYLFADAEPAEVIVEIESMLIQLEQKFTPRVV